MTITINQGMHASKVVCPHHMAKLLSSIQYELILQASNIEFALFSMTRINGQEALVMGYPY